MPTISAAQLDLLRRAQENTIFVYYNPGSVGPDVNERTMRSLSRAGLLKMGQYEALKGYPLAVTTKGLALLIHFGQVAASQGEETKPMDTCPDCGSNATPIRCADHLDCYQCPDCLFCDTNPSGPGETFGLEEI